MGKYKINKKPDRESSEKIGEIHIGEDDRGWKIAVITKNGSVYQGRYRNPEYLIHCLKTVIEFGNNGLDKKNGLKYSKHSPKIFKKNIVVDHSDKLNLEKFPGLSSIKENQPITTKNYLGAGG